MTIIADSKSEIGATGEMISLIESENLKCAKFKIDSNFPACQIGFFVGFGFSSLIDENITHYESRLLFSN